MGPNLQLGRTMLAHSMFGRVPQVAVVAVVVAFIAAAVVELRTLEYSPGLRMMKPPADATCPPPAVKLLATMESPDPAQSMAQVSTSDRGSWTAGVGDSLRPGAVVTAIGSGALTYEEGTATTRLRLAP